MTDSVQLRMQYIGACALLGRVAKYVTDSDDKDSIYRSMRDCAAYIGGFEVVKVTGGWSLEPVMVLHCASPQTGKQP